MEPYPAPPFWHTLALGKPSSSVSFSLSAAPFILSNSSLSSVAPERREKGVSLQSQGWKGPAAFGFLTALGLFSDMWVNGPPLSDTDTAASSPTKWKTFILLRHFQLTLLP